MAGAQESSREQQGARIRPTIPAGRRVHAMRYVLPCCDACRNSTLWEACRTASVSRMHQCRLTASSASGGRQARWPRYAQVR